MLYRTIKRIFRRMARIDWRRDHRRLSDHRATVHCLRAISARKHPDNLTGNPIMGGGEA